MGTTAIYCRRSKNGGDGHDTVESQETELRKYAADHGWDNVTVYRERGVSAGREQDARRRVFYRDLGGAIDRGEVARVLVVEVDRLSRFALTFYTFIERCKALGVEVIATRSGTNLTDPRTSALEVGIRVGLAGEESRIRKDRQASHRARMREAGRIRSGGFRKLGYEWDNVKLRPKEVKLLKRSAEMIAAGTSLHQVTLMWWDAGVHAGRRSEVEAGRGKLLSSTTIRNTLQRSELLDKGTRDEMRRIFSDPERKRRWSGTGPRTYLLTGGYARCGNCGEKLSPHTRYDTRSYACLTRTNNGMRGCHQVRANAIDVEQAVIVALEDAGAKLTLPKSGPASDDTVALEAERNALMSRIEKLEDDYVDGTLSADAVKRQRSRLEAKLEHVDGTLAELARQTVGRRQLEQLREQGVPSYEQAFEELRSLIETMVEKVTVGGSIGQFKNAVMTTFREPHPYPKPKPGSIPKGLPKKVRSLFESGRMSITDLTETGTLPRP